MAKVYYCIYCKRNVVNQRFHDGCRIAHLEILLCEVQTLLKENGANGLPAKLVEQILAEGLTTKTWEEFHKRQSEAVALAMKKQMHDLARLDRLQKVAAELEKEYPDLALPQY